MCMFKTAIIDWNGTALNDLKVVYESVRCIFEAYKLPPPTLREYQTEMSQEWMKFYTRHGIPEETEPKDLNKIRRAYLETHWDDVTLHEGLIEFLQLLKEEQMKSFLVTGEIQEVVERRLQQFYISDLFDKVVAGAYRKAEILKAMLEEFNLLPEETLYVDDDPFGILSAKELGLVTIGMTHGYASTERIRAARPRFTTNHFSSVIGFVKASVKV